MAGSLSFWCHRPPLGQHDMVPPSLQVPIKAWLSTYASEDTFEWFSALPGGFLVSTRLGQLRGHEAPLMGSGVS